MSTSSSPGQTYGVQVAAGGKIELTVPYPAGSQVTVIVLPQGQDEVADLLEASHSSLGFWDNDLDDEDWNNA